MPITARSLTNLKVEIFNGRHEFVADEPESVGGEDAGPNPYDLLLGALAACKVMTAQMYARRKAWPLDEVTVRLDTHKVHARDCDECDSDPNARVDIIEVDIALKGDLTAEQRERIKEIADRCPVHRTLTSETRIHTTLVDEIPVSA